MFGGFGSRFAKFGTGGGGRSIASPADLLQLFKRGSEDGAMIDELDNTTDLELANVNCLSFDGVDDYVNLGNNTDFNTNDTISVSAWFKTSDDTTPTQQIFSKTFYRLQIQDYFGFKNCLDCLPYSRVIETNSCVWY